jgi:phage FluMu gp28-like protein
MHPFFLPYQTRWIRDPSRKRLIEKSRQIGITLATAYDLVVKTGERTSRSDAWVSSRDDLQAQLFAADCARWAQTLHAPCGDLCQRVLDRELKTSAHVLPFDNGRSIYSLSSSPDAQAGKRGHRVFDEFALNPANRQLFGVGFPGNIWGGGMDIISTHRGTGNFFNQLVNEIKHKGNPKLFSLHTVTMPDALQQGLLQRLKSKWRLANPDDDRLNWSDDDFLQSLRDGCPDEETWQQEFLCQPGDDDSAFLSYDLIATCLYKPGEPWEMSIPSLPSTQSTSSTQSTTPCPSSILHPPSSLYVGVDIGRFRDLTVIWVAEKSSHTFFTRKIICLEKQSFESQEAVLYPLLALPSVRRACIDQSGLGCQFVERAKKKFNRYRVEGLTFTAGLKEKLACKLRCAFEDRSIRIPDDRLLAADLRSIRKTVTSAGNIRFEGERRQNSHADRFWAACLALHAAATATDPNRIFAQII